MLHIRYDKHLKHKPSSTARAVYQQDFDGDSGPVDDHGDYVDEGFAPDGIDTPSDDFYNIHTTNFNRNLQVKSLIPRTPPGKHKTNFNKPWHNDLFYLPKHLYDLLNEEAKKGYNKEK